MSIVVTFRHMNTSKPLEEHVIKKLKKFEKYLKNIDFFVTLSVSKHLHKAEININAYNTRIHGMEQSSNMYTSIDHAINKIEKQIRKHHDKATSHKIKNTANNFISYDQQENDNNNIDKKSISNFEIEKKDIFINQMLIDEVINQMNILNKNIYFFINIDTNNINVIIKEKNNYKVKNIIRN